MQPGADVTVAGDADTTFGTFSTPPQGYPTCQPLVFGDRGGRMTGVSPYMHQDVPHLFGLPAPTEAKAVQARGPFVAAEHTRSAPAA